MNIIIRERPALNGKRIYYTLEWGRDRSERVATGIWTHAKPKSRVEKEFNNEQLAILERKRADLIVNRNALATGYINPDKLEKNFFVFYQDFTNKNKRGAKRHLENSLAQLKKFVAQEDGVNEAITLIYHRIDEDFCKKFRKFLLDNFHGETPANYFSEFKKVLKAAVKAYYFRLSPAEDIAAVKNRSLPKDILEGDEVIRMFEAPCPNPDVKKAYIFCMYTGLAWIDVKNLRWSDVMGSNVRYTRAKTGIPVTVPMHPNAIAVLNTQPTGEPTDYVFTLPTSTGAKKMINAWCKNANVTKNITWHSARHYVSVVLQLKGVDAQTVAGILGHTSTKYVQTTYKRYITSAAVEGINKLD